MRAPGKLMIAGEYVVLAGAPALVAAVDRYAVGCWLPRANDGWRDASDRWPDNPSLPAEALVARNLAEAVFQPVPACLHIDVNDLRRDGRKLGLGSSAAAAAVAAGAVMAWSGIDPGRERSRALELAMAGHRQVAPQGSGADVAAAVCGGILRYQLTLNPLNAASGAASTQTMQWQPMQWPSGLHCEVVWTGVEARTSDLVARVQAWAADHEAAYRQCMAVLGEAAAELVDAFAVGDVARLLPAVRQHAEAAAELGHAAGAPIVEERLRRIADLAESVGGAAKPSGAGGGDVALAFFADAEDRAAFRRRCQQAKAVEESAAELVDLNIGAEGLSLLPPDERSEMA